MTLYEVIVKKMGINKGDKLYVSSDLRLLILEFYRRGLTFNVNDLIDAFIHEVGLEGAIVFPTFNWAFCKGETYDYNSTPGLTGSLGNVALERKDFIRTKHPIYSFAVWGIDKVALANLDNKGSFVKGSPFDYFSKNEYKQLLINVTVDNSFTFVHYVEQQLNVNYRYNKKFISIYLDECFTKTYRTYYMFVRPKNQSSYYPSPQLKSEFKIKGISKICEYNNNVFEIIDLREAYSMISKDIINNGPEKRRENDDNI
jgi:aminoglycoside 3-N-acetyltransferase